MFYKVHGNKTWITPSGGRADLMTLSGAHPNPDEKGLSGASRCWLAEKAAPATTRPPIFRPSGNDGHRKSRCSVFFYRGMKEFENPLSTASGGEGRIACLGRRRGLGPSSQLMATFRVCPAIQNRGRVPPSAVAQAAMGKQALT